MNISLSPDLERLIAEKQPRLMQGFVLRRGQLILIAQDLEHGVFRAEIILSVEPLDSSLPLGFQVRRSGIQS